MRQVVAVLHADDVADPPSGRDLGWSHVAQSDVSHESLPLQVREDGESRVDQLAGTISVVEHVAKIDDVEHVDAQIAQVVVHRSDQLVGRCRFEHRSIGPAPCADLGDDDEIIRIRM